MKLKSNTSFIDITPKHKVELAGYSNSSKPFDNIDTLLEVNIIILNKIIFISVDTLFIPDEIKELIVDRLKINKENLFLCATHTHFAPAIDKTKLGLGNPSDEYIEFLIDKIVIETNNLKNSSFIETDIFYGKAGAYHSINRRLKTNNKIYLKPNYNGIKDETISTIVLKNQGKIQSVIINYACHPTSSVDKTFVSSDYIHYIRESIRKKYNNNNLPILFLQGFSGDTRPCCLGDDSSTFQNFTHKEYNSWVNSLSNIVNFSLQNLEKIPFEDIVIKLDELNYDNIINSQDYYGKIYFHKIILGKIMFLGISAEVVTRYAKHIKEKYKNFIVIPVSCANGIFGYIPTDEMIEDGGYESGEFFNCFYINAKFKTKIEDKIKKLL